MILIFREHLGVTNDGNETDVTDPVAASFYKGIWMKQASLNTVVFEKVFKCVPTDSVRSFSELKVSSSSLFPPSLFLSIYF